jgi:mono/diheme cytochrome c family protein
MIKKIALLLLALIIISTVLLIFSYDVVKYNFNSFMEIQPSFGNMEKPLPVPADSIPIGGAAYIPGLGAPENPIETDADSIERGRVLFSVHCAQCHGATAEGNGSVAPFLVNKKPANLTLEATQIKSDGTLFLTISNGVPGAMPALNENLNVRERWDLVNYLRTVAAQQENE